MVEHTTEKAQQQVAAVEALADRWAGVLAECKQTDPRWIIDRSVMTLETALNELRSALALRPPPGQINTTP
jgi:hypothetical protein